MTIHRRARLLIVADSLDEINQSSQCGRGLARRQFTTLALPGD